MCYLFSVCQIQILRLKLKLRNLFQNRRCGFHEKARCVVYLFFLLCIVSVTGHLPQHHITELYIISLYPVVQHWTANENPAAQQSQTIKHTSAWLNYLKWQNRLRGNFVFTTWWDFSVSQCSPGGRERYSRCGGVNNPYRSQPQRFSLVYDQQFTDVNIRASSEQGMAI